MKYFAYGSNMLQQWLCGPDRLSSAVFLSIGYVTGRQLRFHKHSRKDGSAKCDISETGNSADIVFGVLYDVPDNENDLKALDRAEGAPGGYTRTTIDVLRQDAAPLLATVYLANTSHIDSQLSPYDWYHSLVVAGARQHGLPADYIAALSTVVAIPDPTPDREMRLTALQALREANVQ
jgi:cation transport regulator ChaC